MQKFSYVVLFFVLLLSVLSVTTAQQENSTIPLKIAFTSNRDGNEDIFVMPADASLDPINLTRSPARDFDPTWSPDGARIAFVSDREDTQNIWVMDFDGTNPSLLIPRDSSGLEYDDISPAWSPDGNSLAFISGRSGVGYDLYITDTEDPTNTVQLTNTQRIKGHPSWSPDGQWIAFWELQREGGIHLFKIEVATQRIQLLVANRFNNGMPVWSPDGQSIVFESDRDGTWGLYRMGINGEQPTRISPEGVNSGRAAFSPDSNQLVFVTDRDESDELYIMDIDGGGVTRLTQDEVSDFDPAWQPTIPEIEVPAIVLQAPTAAPLEATPTPSAQQATFGQNFNGFDTRPVTLDTLKIDYGISAWHQAGWTGTGVSVGVIDTGFGGLADLITAKGFQVTLPPGDELALYQNELNDHGTDVLELVQAVAPGAELFACRYDGTYDALLDCVKWLEETVKADVINHSAGLPALPLDGTNPWAEMASQVYDRGALWVNSAGNFNRSFLADNFRDVEPADGDHDFVTGSRTDDVLRFDVAPYSGNVILTWPVEAKQRHPQTGQEISMDFNLQVVDLTRGQVIAESTLPQSSDPLIPPQEVVYLTVDQPWGVRILNAGQPIFQPVELLLFVEFAPIAGAEISGSVIAPADAKNVLTVGSVTGTNILAEYSSRGVRSTNAYNKPDISAPGEIILHDNETFVGTSAASPIAAGMAALVLNSDPTLFVDELREYMIASVIPTNDNNYGRGILTLGKPPLNPLAEVEVIEVEAKTVWEQPVEQADNIIRVCSGALSPRLEVGAQGFVTFNLGFAIRAEPGGPLLRNLPLGTEFKVIGGPVCNTRNNWWQVELQVNEENAGTGWVAEADDYYFISPRVLERAILPGEYEYDCPLAPTSQLAVGDRAVTTDGDVLLYRRTGGRTLIGPLSEGVEVHILGGPLCEGSNDNILRWYVRVMSGEWTDNEGWVAEATTLQRLLVKLT